MNQNKPAQRILAWMLSVVMVFSMTPVSAAAETSLADTTGEIIGFEALAEEISNQEVALGTSLGDLHLPETLTATVRLQTQPDEAPPVQDSGEPQGEEPAEPEQPATPSDAAAPGEDNSGGQKDKDTTDNTGKPALTEQTINLPVAWQSEPDYDADTADIYLFAPILPSSYTMTEGIDLPVITVTVGDDGSLPDAPLARGTFGVATEQFDLAPGGTYYFDLSGETIPGTVNTSLPDGSLKWVPFTYAGTINAYNLETAGREIATTEARANELLSDRSLFVADHNITLSVSWDELNASSNNLIFGKSYTSGGVGYKLRSLSMGSEDNEQPDDQNRGMPEINEWDQILNKYNGFIQAYYLKATWGQDTLPNDEPLRVCQGFQSARFFNWGPPSLKMSYIGFRPALEILNPDTLGSDGLKTVTYDIGSNGTLGAGSLTSATMVYTGTLILPEITEANGFQYTGATGAGTLGWYDEGNQFYKAGTALTDLPTGTTLTPGYGVTEQFTLTPGETYYFDLSGETIPGTKNTDLPDSSLKWVPFTYAGTINAYNLETAGREIATTEARANELLSDRSLFVADYNVTNKISWDNLHTNNLIFGKNYTSGGVDYTLRSLSVGSGSTGYYDAMRGTPETNEWDQLLNKDTYIKNWSEIYSWGQDTHSNIESYRAFRGYDSARCWEYDSASLVRPVFGFRPALEILNPATLGPDGLKTVTYDMGSKGTLGEDLLQSATVVYTGTLILPEITEANGFNYAGAVGAGTLGWYDGSTFYAPGQSLTDLADRTILTAGVYNNEAPPTDKTLVSITSPSAITGVSNGTAKTAAALGLPAKVTLVTDGGNVQADVAWDVTGSSYDQSDTSAQTFTVSGTVTLPSGVSNLNNVGLSTSIRVTVNAKSSSGGGSSSDDRPHITVIPPAPDKPNTPTQGEIKKEGKVDGTGNGAANISEKDTKAAYEKALKAAKKNGNEKNGIAITVRINTDKKTAVSISFSLPKAVQDYIIAKEIRSITLVSENPAISMTLDLAAVKEIRKQANGDVTITAARMESSNLKNAKAAIGSRPAFDLTVSYGKGKAVQNFEAGNVAVAIPYILAANETSGNVQAVYVDAQGKVQWLISSVYDGVERVLRFSTSHFSTYGIGYKKDAPTFTDIGSHWAKDDIAFVVNRGLFSGTSATTFSPNTAMTRGMFVTTLGRLANVDVNAYKQSSFIDVKADVYYMGYIEWANKNNIVNGIGDYKFAPDQSITREQMAVIMTGYAKTIGYNLPKVHVENTFADNVKINAYAKDAVKQMQIAGVISGKNGNLYDPQDTATRAEVSAVLRRFVERAISSDRLQGWTMNDSGNWMYYENGKPVTDKKDIDGSTYTFDQYGVTADVPKNLRYTTYIVQKGDSFWLIARKLGCTMSELERLNNKSRFSIIYPGDILRVPEK